MFKIALKSLLGHKLRMLLTACSIIIGVSFVAGSYIFTDSMSKTFNGIFENVYGAIDVTVRPKQTDFSTSTLKLPADVLQSVKQLPNVDQAEGQIGGIATLIKADGTPIGGNGPPTLGFSWGDVRELNPLHIKEGNGREPREFGEVVIDANTAVSNDLKVGDKVRVQAYGPVEDFTVVGIASFGETDSLAGATLSAFTLDQAAELFNFTNEFSEISMTARDGVSPEQLQSEVATILPENLEAITGEQQSAEQLDQFSQALGFVNTALLAFAAVSIFVGAFIIQNTFRIIVAQRSKELALLRAVGASRGQVVRMVLYEAFLIALIASGLGILAGIGVSSALRAAANAAGLGLPTGELTVAARTVYVSLSVGVVVTLVSALAPAVKASRVSPVEAMRDLEMSRPARSLRTRAVLGLLVSALGAAAMMVGLFTSIQKPVYAVGGGAGVLFIGVAILAPLLTGLVANIVGAPLLARYKIIGKIARQNTKRSPRRAASTAAALMIGVSLVVFSSILASSIRASVDVIVADTFPGDILIMPKNSQGDPSIIGIPHSIADEVRALDEIELVSSVIYNFAEINGNQELIAAVEPSTFNEVYNLKPTNDAYQDLVVDTVYISADSLNQRKLNIGDELNLTVPSGEQKPFKITGSFSEAFDSDYIISRETHTKYFGEKSDIYSVANIADGTRFEDAKNAVNAVLERYPTAKGQDKNEFIADARKQIDQVLALMTTLLAFAIIIAMLGITNTLTLSVAERTREIGMLRAVGMTRRQIRQMIRAEAIIISVFGALLGVVLGIFFGWAILRALRDEGFKSFSIPVIQIIVYLALSALAGVVAAIAPSFKASRMNILKAINYE